MIDKFGQNKWYMSGQFLLIFLGADLVREHVSQSVGHVPGALRCLPTVFTRVCLSGHADLILNFKIRKRIVDLLLNLIFKISFISDKGDSLLSICLYLLFYLLISSEHERVGWKKTVMYCPSQISISAAWGGGRKCSSAEER